MSKVHLRFRGWWVGLCGLSIPWDKQNSHWSNDASKITCKRCIAIVEKAAEQLKRNYEDKS